MKVSRGVGIALLAVATVGGIVALQLVDDRAGPPDRPSTTSSSGSGG